MKECFCTNRHRWAHEGVTVLSPPPPDTSFARSTCLNLLSSRTETDAAGETCAGGVSNLSHTVGGREPPLLCGAHGKEEQRAPTKPAARKQGKMMWGSHGQGQVPSLPVSPTRSGRRMTCRAQ